MSELDTTGGPEPALREPRERKPSWLKVRAPSGARYLELKETLRELELHTVCEEARCPNVAECWGAGTATVMVLGDTCTRGCRFCAVKTGNPRGAVDPREPEHVARALTRLGLRYIVLTMVDRDDLLDGGAAHVVETVVALKRYQPGLLVEALVGDFRGKKADIASVQSAPLDVFAHNLEVVERLTPAIRDRRCSYAQTLGVLAYAKELAPARLTKSSIMVGVGETDEEVLATLRDLRQAQVDIVTIGQYLRPSPKHAAVARYVPPETFGVYERAANELGFAFVASGPLVRSSYHAAEAFVGTRLGESGLAESGVSEASLGESAMGAQPLALAPESRLVSAERLVRR